MGDNGAMSSDDDVVRLNREGEQDTNPRLNVRQQAVWRFI
jgi:hypothetical protein